MTAWPTLSKKPEQSTWVETKDDPTLSTDVDGGYTITRPRFMRAPRKIFRFEYRDLTNADKEAFDDFLDTVKIGSASFDFPHPFNGNTYTMRLVTKTNGRPPEIHYANYTKAADGTDDHHWDITMIEVEQV